MEADDIGVAAMLLGAGRATKEDEIDLAVGIVLTKKIGDHSASRRTACHHPSEQRKRSNNPLTLIQNHIHIQIRTSEKPALIHEMITG